LFLVHWINIQASRFATGIKPIVTSLIALCSDAFYASSRLMVMRRYCGHGCDCLRAKNHPPPWPQNIRELDIPVYLGTLSAKKMFMN
jgi:hypothetical protein